MRMNMAHTLFSISPSMFVIYSSTPKHTVAEAMIFTP